MFVLLERKCPAKWTSQDIPPWFQFEANVYIPFKVHEVCKTLIKIVYIYRGIWCHTRPCVKTQSNGPCVGSNGPCVGSNGPCVGSNGHCVGSNGPCEQWTLCREQWTLCREQWTLCREQWTLCRELWTLCREHVNRNTVHARSALLTSWLSESGVLTKRDMQNMQSGGGGGARTGIENLCSTVDGCRQNESPNSW